MSSVLVWGYNWTIFILGWFCQIHLIQWKSVHFEKKLDYANRCRTRGFSFIQGKKHTSISVTCLPWARIRQYPLWLWNPDEMSPEVRNRGISGPTKRTHVLQKFKKKHTSERAPPTLALNQSVFIRILLYQRNRLQKSNFVFMDFQ